MPIVSTKGGRVVRYEKPQMSTHAKIQYMLRELGRDTAQTIRDMRWETFCVASSMAINFQNQ
jgi:hypothetical protein